MAYTPVINKQLKDIRQEDTTILQSGGPSMSDSAAQGQVGGDVISSAQQLALQGNGGLGNQFVNFGDLVEANKAGTTDYANQIGRTIGIDQADRAISSAAQDVQNKAQAGYTNLDDNILQNIVGNPFENTEGYNTLTEVLGGRAYRGPTDATSLYQDAVAKARSTKEAASLLGSDPSKLTALLAANPTNGATRGGIQLDAALLSGTEGAQQAFGDVRGKAEGLTGKLTTSQGASQDLIKGYQAQAEAAKNKARSAVETGLNTLKQQNTDELAQARAREARRAEEFTQAAAEGNLSKLQEMGINIDAPQFDTLINKIMNGMPEDAEREAVAGRAPIKNFGKQATWINDSLTTGNVLDAGELARLQGLSKLLGSQDTFAQAAGEAGRGAFDQTAALEELRKQILTGNVKPPKPTPVPEPNGRPTGPAGNAPLGNEVVGTPGIESGIEPGLTPGGVTDPWFGEVNVPGMGVGEQTPSYPEFTDETQDPWGDLDKAQNEATGTGEPEWWADLPPEAIALANQLAGGNYITSEILKFLYDKFIRKDNPTDPSSKGAVNGADAEDDAYQRAKEAEVAAKANDEQWAKENVLDEETWNKLGEDIQRQDEELAIQDIPDELDKIIEELQNEIQPLPPVDFGGPAYQEPDITPDIDRIIEELQNEIQPLPPMDFEQPDYEQPDVEYYEPTVTEELQPLPELDLPDEVFEGNNDPYYDRYGDNSYTDFDFGDFTLDTAPPVDLGEPSGWDYVGDTNWDGMIGEPVDSEPVDSGDYYDYYDPRNPEQDMWW